EKRVGFTEVYGSWWRGDSVFALSGGGFATIRTAWFEQNGAGVRDLLSAQAARASATALVQPYAQLCPDLEFAEPEWIKVERDRWEAVEQICTPKLPSGFKPDLRAYQQDGVVWLQKLGTLGFGGLLCD